ncbi:MAG: DUF4126 family protein [Polyangiaceae bacterium]|nr:DUF4126 family protein [Polyangiaceae bacterium]
MDLVPTSVVAAVGCSAAAGKNPWVPLALVFLLAAPERAPTPLIDAQLHGALHAMGPPSLLWGLGAFFLVVSILESLADKISFVEQWLVPVSTAWRPFAGVAVSALIAWSTANAPAPALDAATAALKLDSATLATGTAIALTVATGAVFALLSTIGKTGVRLLLSFVPIPSLRLAHSFVDDAFAFVASVATLAVGASPLVLVAALLYLAVGLVVSPLLARLAWIHVRIGAGLLRKAWRALRRLPAAPRRPSPAVARALRDAGLDPSAAGCVECFLHRAPELGRFRAGTLVVAPGGVRFVTRVWWRRRVLAIEEGALVRLGLAESATNRVLTLSRRSASGGVEGLTFTLFPAFADEAVAALERGAATANLVRVRPSSESARRGVEGYAERGQGGRYLPAPAAGSLRTQVTLGIAGAIAGGVLTAGAFVPIGLGYLASPFRWRAAVGLLASGYLTLWVLGTFGAAWPVALVYSTLLNAIALRDLARAALKARIDGVVDRRAFLPPVSGRVWVPAAGLAAETDRHRPGDPSPLTEGPLRAVLAALEADQRGAVAAA